MAILIAYFSRGGENYVSGALKKLEIGNTEVAAGIIQKFTDGELFKLEPVQEYSADYSECIAEAKADQRRDARPELRRYPENFQDFDVIYLGYPNYWGTMPMCVFTFLERFDFTGKTIKPFCTHESSGMGRSEADIRQLCPTAKVYRGLPLTGSRVKQSEEEIKRWCQSIDG